MDIHFRGKKTMVSCTTWQRARFDQQRNITSFAARTTLSVGRKNTRSPHDRRTLSRSQRLCWVTWALRTRPTRWSDWLPASKAMLMTFCISMAIKVMVINRMYWCVLEEINKFSVQSADDHVFHFERTWLAYLRMVTDAQLFSTPWMCSPGNHEWASRDPFLYRATRNFKVYNQYFQMPQTDVGAKANSSMWYSFNYGPVHWVSYNTESTYPGAPHDKHGKLFGDQLSWLTKDLAHANTPAQRRLRPWIIVSGHRPIYSSSKGYSKDGLHEKKKKKKLF